MPGDLNWKEKMLAAKEAGFDFIEISIDETDAKLARLDMSGEERLELVSLMRETGVPIRTMCLSGHRKYPLGSNDPEICARGMEIMEKAIILAEDLGIRIIQLAGYDVYYEEGLSLIHILELKGDMVMDGVDFGYTPEKMVLHDIKLYATPGQKIAFVGSTGAGKTTITNLLNRFYDIQDGKIRYDGININKIRKADLRRSLGIVLQETQLFTDTVMENIRYGRLDASDEEVLSLIHILYNFLLERIKMIKYQKNFII